jgi:DNA-binding transcriptional regulator YiaG
MKRQDKVIPMTSHKVPMAIDELSEQVRARASLPPLATRRALREAAGASMREVARACNVSKQAVALWEAGVCSPRGANLVAYAEVLRLFRESA